MSAHPQRVGARPHTPYDLLDNVIAKLAVRNAAEGLRSHGRRCRCIDCAGWRSFIAAAGKRVQS